MPDAAEGMPGAAVKRVRLTRRVFEGKTLDIHSHAGVSLKAYACQEYPYAATIEGLAGQQAAHGVDANVVFPFTADLFFDPVWLAKGRNRPARRPLSPSPYAVENELLLREAYEFCPELSARFLPFVSVDPGRKIREQERALRALARRFPVYGIKINPVLCQSRITGLLGRGGALLDLAREMDWPLLLHTTSVLEEAYSNADLTFRVVERNPDLRWCLAHAILFHRGWLRRADGMPNVWVDTAALKIQVQLVRDNPDVLPRPQRLDADFRDHRKVMRALMDEFPDTIVWGSDAPAYSYICRRMQSEGVFTEFRLKATYADEVEALDALPPALRRRACNANSLDFLFGNEKEMKKGTL